MYSTNQRFVLLNALANGARELAFDEKSISDEGLFPSRLLDGDRHRAYQQNEIKPLLNPNRILAVGQNDTREKQTNEKTLIRSRQLRVLSLNHQTMAASQGPRRVTFSKVGAEYFIAPFISQFWTYLREDRTRELRTYQGSHSYKGSGTGMILNPLMLSHLLRSLAIMIHAAQNSPAFLSVLAPEALELNLALSTRSAPLFDHEQIESSAAVLSASMELVLTVLISCQELDRGRSLCLDNATLLLGIGEWMDQVISQLEAGIRYTGTGGSLETTLIKNALGVASKVSEIASLWRGSMVDIFS
jgi:telomere length regulation protein